MQQVTEFDPQTPLFVQVDDKIYGPYLVVSSNKGKLIAITSEDEMEVIDGEYFTIFGKNIDES